MGKRESAQGPFSNPRNPRPKGAQKGVAKRDNGRRSQFQNARNPVGKPVRITRGW